MAKEQIGIEEVLKWHSNRRSSTIRTLLLVAFLVAFISLASYIILLLPEMTQNLRVNFANNGSFERWIKGLPAGWQAQKVMVFDETVEPADGRHSAGLFNSDTAKGALCQIIRVDPAGVYTLAFAVRSMGNVKPGSAGYLIEYVGEQVKTTYEVSQGFHPISENSPEWKNVFGRFTGANAVKICFVTSNGTILNVDDVWLGEVVSSEMLRARQKR